MSLFQPLPDFKLTSGGKTLDLSRPKIMGILNVTPDSFSDGGKFNGVDSAVKHCEQLLNDGATIIDIGGESTRPNAKVVSTQEELSRVVPVTQAIRKQFGDDIWLSIDTSNPEVMRAAAAAGADIWNDVRALTRKGARDMAATLNIPVMLMHMRGEPTTMNDFADYHDVVTEVIRELSIQVETALQAGVCADNIIIDPGFGFAKNYQHHCELLTHLEHFKIFHRPLMFGVSRKRFLAEVLNKSGIAAWQQSQALERDWVGSAAGLIAIQQGASIIRTHQVAMMAQAATLWEQLSDCQRSY